MIFMSVEKDGSASRVQRWSLIYFLWNDGELFWIRFCLLLYGHWLVWKGKHLSCGIVKMQTPTWSIKLLRPKNTVLIRNQGAVSHLLVLWGLLGSRNIIWLLNICCKTASKSCLILTVLRHIFISQLAFIH